MSTVHQYKSVIQETWIDSFGHMNNAAYLELFEQARWDWIVARGWGLKQILEEQVGVTLLEINLKFFKEILARESVVVTVETVDYNRKIGRLVQRMVKSDGTVAAEAAITYGLFDMKARKLVEPTPQWKRTFGIED